MLLLSEDQEQKRGDDQIRLCDTAPVLTITHYKITHYTHYCHYSNVLQSNITSHFYSTTVIFVVTCATRVPQFSAP